MAVTQRHVLKEQSFFSKINDHSPKIIDSLLIIASLIAICFLSVAAANQRIFVKFPSDPKFPDAGYHTYTATGAFYIASALGCSMLFLKFIFTLFEKCWRGSAEKLIPGTPYRNLQDYSKKRVYILGLTLLALVAICVFTAIKADKEVEFATKQMDNYYRRWDEASYKYIGSFDAYAAISGVSAVLAITAAVFFHLDHEGLYQNDMNDTDMAKILDRSATLDELTDLTRYNFGRQIREGDITLEDLAKLRALANKYRVEKARLEQYAPRPLHPVPPEPSKEPIKGTTATVDRELAQRGAALAERSRIVAINEEITRTNENNKQSHEEATQAIARLDSDRTNFKFLATEERSVTFQEKAE